MTTSASPPPAVSAEDLARGVLAGDRARLARAITLIESVKPEHHREADRLLSIVAPKTGGAHRIGISGVPGVGKSTLIDELGSRLIAKGHKVAVLAVDPSSPRSGGSILGDKTRMVRLAADPNAFIRPSPTSGTLGGVARRTRETLALCEAAGFDVVIVETVGVGQSEVAVAGMVDVLVVLLLAGGGDDLQGIKKGIIEAADIIAITKADGGNREAAVRAAAEYRGALNILAPALPDWRPPVVTLSAMDAVGVDELWAVVLEHRKVLTASGALAARRRDQAVLTLKESLAAAVLEAVLSRPKVAARLQALTEAVRAGAELPDVAVRQLLAELDLDGAAP